MINAAILEKLEQLPEHVQQLIIDLIDFLYEKYMINATKETSERIS